MSELNDQFPVEGTYFADDTSIAFYIKYVGDEASAKVGVHSSTGDIHMKIGDSGSEAASTAATWKESGGTAGNWDVSDANGDTVAELIDAMNATGSYKIKLVNARREDKIGTTAKLKVLTATQCKTSAGVAVYWDTSACRHHSIRVGKTGFPSASNSKDTSQNGYKAQIFRIAHKNTGSVVGTVRVYEMNDRGTSTEVYRQAAAATTVEKLIEQNDVVPIIESHPGKTLLIRAITTGPCTGYLSAGHRTVPVLQW